MRIALITTTFLPEVGGAEFTVHHLAQQWSRQGHEVFVLNAVADRVWHSDARYSVVKYPILRGAFRLGHHRFPFAQFSTHHLRRHLGRIGPDLISAHFGYPTSIWLSKLRPVPRFLVTCHGEEIHESPEYSRHRYGIDRILARALNRSDAVIAISSYARRVLEKIGVEPSRIHLIPNGADRRRFEKRVTDFDLRMRFGIPRNATVVLSVGRNNPDKAYDIGLKAFSRAVGDQGNFYYVILGPNTGRWRGMAEALGVSKNVVFCDELFGDDLVGTYQQADIFLMPSRREVCPLVIPEALSAGLPVVATDVGGCQDMVVDGVTGRILPVGDVEQIAAAIRSLLSEPSTRQRMGQAASARSEAYDWSKISQAYLDLFLSKNASLSLDGALSVSQ